MSLKTISRDSRKAQACSNWKFLPGMRCRDIEHDDWVRVLAAVPSGVFVWPEGSDSEPVWREALDLFPDFEDAATLGCLLMLLREAWGARVWAQNTRGTWEVLRAGYWKELLSGCKTEVEALVCALSLAPLRPQICQPSKRVVREGESSLVRERMISEWIRSTCGIWEEGVQQILLDIADQIEGGDHLKYAEVVAKYAQSKS